MSITSTLFVFLFLPIALAIYWISNDSVKEYVLLVISLFFYSIGSIDNILLFIFSIAATVVIGHTMASVGNNTIKQVLLVAGIVLDVAFLFYFKYFNFTITTWGQLTGSEVELKAILLPLGISFYTFKAISYMVDIYTGKAKLDDNIAHDLLHLSLFSQIQSGPITRYNDFKRIDKDIADIFSDGAIRL